MRLRSGSTLTGRGLASVAVASMVMAAGAVFAAPAPVQAASAWQTVASPNAGAPANAELNSVACPSASNCFAVGMSTGVQSTASLIERWNGRAWSVVNAPDPNGAIESRFLGIGCFNRSNCIASGDYQLNGHRKGLIERWNGSTWSVLPFPEVFQLSQLAAVACPAARICFVVGSRYAHVIVPVVARWNGTTWSLLPTPAVASSFALQGVSCPSTTNCLAVGTLSTGAQAVKWDGTQWSLVTGSDDLAPGLASVACPSVSVCFAVGSDGDEVGVIERYDGTTLQRLVSPAGVDAVELSSVTCTSVSNCVAVGEQEGLTPTVIEQWNGSAWSVVASPTPPGEISASLSGVACANAAACFAVGATGARSSLTVADRWDGATWSRQATPTPVPAADVLVAVTCPSATSCIAVGHYDTDSFADPPNDTPLIEEWNGTSWTIDPHVAPAGLVQFVGVACPSSTNCFAVGTENDDDFDTNADIEQWDGSHWVPVTPEIPGGEINQLFGVTCAGPKRCFAFGYYYPQGQHVALVEQWSGSTWSAMPNPPVNFGSLYNASCPTSTTCFAVGLMNGEGAPTTLVERWNGSKWSVMTSPAPAGEAFSQLSSVSCSSTTSCFAVGKYYLTNSILGPSRPFVEQYDGKKWRLVAGLNPAGATSGELTSVTCSSAASCVAAGDYTVNNITKPLVERWNGTRWSFDATPVPARARSTILSGTACRARIGCFVVGNSSVRDSQTTFVQRHS